MYKADYDQLNQHQAPQWFEDAKFGIFIHWGLYSVPAYAPKLDMAELFKNFPLLLENFSVGKNPYSEWYLNSLLASKESPTYKYHCQKYGENFSYYDFADEFKKESMKMDPEQWATLFEEVGAKYVVLVTKHHDGFTMWPTEHKHLYKEGYASNRDIVGELSQKVKAHNMRMGLYYSSLLDWSYVPSDNIIDRYDEPDEPKYPDLQNKHWKELIDKYKPSILWSDIGYPKEPDLNELISYFYNTIEDGVINDRWNQQGSIMKAIAEATKNDTLKELFEYFEQHKNETPKQLHDFITPEYAVYDEIKPYKWESTRGIGNSFAYNREESAEDILSIQELISMFIDLVSKNGNLLLNVGPKADGTIPQNQVDVLKGFGKWLKANQEAIYGTRPWVVAQTTSDVVRFTCKNNSLYTIFLEKPAVCEIKLENIIADKDTVVNPIGCDCKLEWCQSGDDIIIKLPDNMPEDSYTLKITPKPTYKK